MVRSVLCVGSADANEILNSDTYDLYTGTVSTTGVDIRLLLSLKDSQQVITVGVPEASGNVFPVATEDFFIAFSTN